VFRYLYVPVVHDVASGHLSTFAYQFETATGTCVLLSVVIWTSSCQTCYMRSSVCWPEQWNSLSYDLKDNSLSLPVFERHLKTSPSPTGICTALGFFNAQVNCYYPGQSLGFTDLTKAPVFTARRHVCAVCCSPVSVCPCVTSRSFTKTVNVGSRKKTLQDSPWNLHCVSKSTHL